MISPEYADQSTPEYTPPLDGSPQKRGLGDLDGEPQSGIDRPIIGKSPDETHLAEQAEAAQKTQDIEIKLSELQVQTHTQLDEILALYRRLHIELDDAGRSKLIVDLFNDPRLEVELLGFELVDRDLSSSTVLGPGVGERAKGMLNDPNPLIRSKAARLITRLVPPDAMIVLANSLKKESDPIAAEPMLLGVARWPSPEAVEPVLRWFLRTDSPFESACSAAWSIEQAGYWDDHTQHPLILDRLRQRGPKNLSEAGMKLLARLGDASDLQMLVSLLLSPNKDQQQWSAHALVETPRAVEVLVQAAEGNAQLFGAAGDSLILHRATPEGLRRLVSLPYPDEQTRMDEIMRMGEALDNDRLGEAVRLAGLKPKQSALLLNRLLKGDVEITPRVARGIIQLGEIELDELRPNRALEATLSIEKTALDPTERSKVNLLKSTSLILLGKFDDAYAVSVDPQLWYAAFQRATDIELRKRIAHFMVKNFESTLTGEQIAEIKGVAGIDQPASKLPPPPIDGG